MPLSTEPQGRITGIGGIVFRSKNPGALMAWYRDVLGIRVPIRGGAMLAYDAQKHPPAFTLNAFNPSSDYMQPSRREFMLNFAVDDLPAFLARLEGRGVTVLMQDDTDPTGRFAWIIDPEGTKIELWEPRAEPPSA